MDRHSGGGTLPHLRGRPVSGLEAAHANEYFDPFLNATTLKNILGYHRSMCEFLHLKPNVFPHFYPKLRANLTSWRAKAVWKKFDARASHKCYGKGKICAGTRVLVIGAGPCGLRTAIEAQLLGAKVVLIEKRDRLSRNNVLHLWPFVIEDLRMLGAKKFFGKFCAGAIDHISIRQLQCILLKVALLLGVEVHTEVSFEHLLEPSATEKTGWRAEIKPENHPVSQYEFDVIIGADGKRNTLQGFKRKEFRGKLAIAITANFINKKSEAEARVEEISGVAFIFNQKFFKDLQGETRIDLENIVYYKDDTHYFVMTAKKASLLEKGVIKQDLSDTEKLLAQENVDREALQNYARQAADFSTNYQLPHMEFAVNHYGQPDVAMFDFTSMYAAEYASKVVERHGSRLLMILVGDSLLEPFWPTGSGCARGFLSSLDAAWAIRSYCSGQMTPLDVLAERESIYRLLAQTTPDNLNKDWKAYTLDPATRYPNLNKSVVTPHQTVCLYDTDNADSIDKMKRASLEAVSRQDHVPKKRRRGNVDNEVLLTWLSEQLRDHPDLAITDISSAFRKGKTLCAIIHHYRPDLLDYSAIQDNDAGKCNQMAMDILERDLGLPPFMTGEEITNTEDYLALTTYLTQVYDTFRGEIPHIKHPKLMLKPRTNISKPASKSRTLHMSAAFLEKVKNLDAKCSQKTAVSAIKHKASKAGGDTVSVGREQKCDKLRTFFKDSKVKTRIERLGSGKGQRPISNDDSTVLQKDRRSRIPKKKLPKRHSLDPKPLQTLSEKTFLTASIKSFDSAPKAERHVKMDFFDLTYSDNGLLRKNHSILRPQTEKTSKLPKKACSYNVREDRKAKKHKSRNVSLYVNLSERKPLKSKNLKTKKSKLSMIPENTEDKLNEIAKITNHRADKANRANELVTKQPSLSVANSVKVFRCETFVHDSAGSLTLPSIRSTEQLLKKQSSSLELAEPSGQLVATTAKHKKSEIIHPPVSKTSLGKLRHERNLLGDLLGLASLSPLQVIRKHILMKKQQLSLVLSKPKVARLKSDNAAGNSSSFGTSYSSTESINIQVIHHSSSDRITCQNVEYKSSRNLVKITSKAVVSKHPSTRGESEQMMNSHRNSTLNYASTEDQEILERPQNFLREAPEPGRNFPRYPDLKIHRRMKIRKSRTRLQAKKNPPLLTPADRQIIDSLGITGESVLRKTCQQTSHNREVERKRKFSLRSAIGRRQRLYGDHRPAKELNHLPQFSGSLDREGDIKMEFFDDAENISPQMYTRVQKWISQHDFRADEGKKDLETETLITCDLPSDITSVTRAHLKRKGEYDDIKVEERTDVIKCESPTQSSQEDFVELVKLLKDGKATAQKEARTPIKPMSKYSQFNMKSVSAPPANFSVIIEGEESELPESNKRSEFSFKSIKTSNHQPSIPNNQPSIPSSRHKRHADIMVPKPSSIDRKQRKRRTLETIGPSVEERQRTLQEISSNRQDRQSKRKQQRQRQTEQFIKSMQMLQANCKPDCSEPFEDYSIFLYRQTAPKFQDRVKDLEKQFTYVPDYDSRITGLKPLANTNAEEDIAAKIRSLEDKWSGQAPSEKKPKDLMRAIGKIETSDWNIKQIEKKILENKIGKPSTLNTDKERVPRWSKEEFRARQTKMEKKHLDRQESTEAKYADIDRNIKQLELKLKEGTNRELGQNKVASITEKLVNKTPQEDKPVEKPAQPKPVGLPVQSGSEFCHFCWKRVYLMERVSAEGKFFHHRCFKCKYCHSQLRLGSYMFDRDGQYDYGFFCIHHFGMQGELPRPAKVTRKPSVKGSREAGRSPQKKPLSAVAGVDLLDRVRTPERIEFANLSTDNISDHEEPLSQMDEDEWTDKNFGASCNELDDSDDDSSSSVSDTDSDDEDAFDDALEQPVTKEGTMKWAERLKNSYRKGHHSDSDGYSSSDHSSYYENSTDDSDSDTATEGEEEIRARELRRQEVRVEPPVVQPDTGTDTEVKKSLDIIPLEMVPDILNDHNNRLDPKHSPTISKSPSNYSINSEVFNSAESDLDFNMNQTSALNPNVVVGKLTFAPKADSKCKQQSSPLAKSATAGNLGSKPKRNFVLPPREQRRSFGQEFTPKFKLEEPLLVIKRTPSKVNLPKEIKPKVAVNAKVLDANKYFGAPMHKLQRSGTRLVCPKPKPQLVKQTSLPETGDFNFDLKDSDLDNVDNYIEDLLTNQEELSKPVDISKYIQPAEEQDEDVSSSIEDLFSALEKTADAPNIELQKESDEKIEDLLKWMEELDHQTPARKVYRSVSDAKYKNLENLLKRPQTADSLVSKLPKNNVAFFEAILKGKPLAKDSSSEENVHETRSISRSKTEVHFNRSKHPRTSVDLDAVSKVNIKSVLKKFESLDQEDAEVKCKPEKPAVKRFSLGNFPAKLSSGRELKAPIVKPKPIGKTIKKFESQPKEFKKIEYKPPHLQAQRSFEDSIKDLEKFVDDTIESIGKNSKSGDLGKSKSDWCVNVTVCSKVSPEFLKLQQRSMENESKPVAASESGNVESNPTEADFAKELKDFQVAMSALTDEASTSEETPKPHNFFKAVESSDSSAAEELEQPESSISSEYKKEAALPHGFTPAGQSSSFESENVEVEDLYSKVVKPRKEPPCSPAAPPRRKHSQGSAAVPLPPARAARQKSQDLTVNNENVPQPIAPQRKRCNTASPLVGRKNPELKPPLNRNGKSTSTSNLEKVIVGSFELPGPQKVSISGTKSLSSENLPKFPPKYGRKDKDKDCCIQ